MIFEQIESGGDRNYAYLVACEKTGKSAIIDPSPEPDKVLAAIKEQNCRITGINIDIEYVINTHGHYDHSGGNDYFKKIAKDNQIKFFNCRAVKGQIQPEDRMSINIGTVKLEIVTTPGHTPDSICILAGGKLITGDTLFVGKVGGTYRVEDAVAEFESLKKIMSLPPETEIWPGHNYGVKPHSTVAYELENNPFILRLSDFDSFLWLKQNWADYKAEHGIK
jgi:glyoxylase-like metal-dependent hydrolase (beta-lactamase superfamily II)